MVYFCNILRMYHPDCVQDYVPAEVLAHAVALAAASAAGGGGGGMVTHNVSLDEPVSQLCFYRMVQAAVQRLPNLVLCETVTLCTASLAARLPRRAHRRRLRLLCQDTHAGLHGKAGPEIVGGIPKRRVPRARGGFFRQIRTNRHDQGE